MELSFQNVKEVSWAEDLVPSHTTLVCMLRLLAVSYVGLDGETAFQRMGLIDDINEELDIIE